MSELIINQDRCETLRWRLLRGASVLVLTACAGVYPAVAENNGKPEVWIELGGQLSRLTDGVEPFSPPALEAFPSIFEPATKSEKQPGYSLDETGSLSFQPHGSDWVFSASIRYGRSISTRHAHGQTYPGYAHYPSALFGRTVVPRAARFADTKSSNAETHAVVDFTAGKDVGLGLFGSGSGSSTLNMGVRFAQFTSKSNIALKSDPDWHLKPKYFTYYSSVIKLIVQPYHSNAASLIADRSFHGLGPTVSWKSSVPLAGGPHENELDFDWGVNAAVLFGRQKATVKHSTTVRYNDGGTGIYYPRGGILVTTYRNEPPTIVRSRSVVVPNVGGFAGLSFRYDNAKVSFGYRGDFFFGAMDGGIDTAKSYDRNFFGPYATISIGLGG